MLIQLTPQIPVKTPRGSALAHFVIDYGLEHDLFWVCFQDDTGECWTWNNKDIRAQTNITAGREHISPFYEPEDVAFNSSNSEWVSTSYGYPAEEEYVLIWVEGYVGISRYIDGEWDTGEFRKRPMFTKSGRIMSKLEAEYWMPLPEPPES